MKAAKIVLPILLLFFVTLSLNSQVNNKRIKFKHGNVSATVFQGINEGVTDTYLVKAKANQHMAILIMSPEDNTVFWVLNKKTGKYLGGAESDANAKNWEGDLPSSGDYKIFVGTTRGFAQYKMRVTIE